MNLMNLMYLFLGLSGGRKNIRLIGAKNPKNAIFFAFCGGLILVHSDTSSTSGHFLGENRIFSLFWMYLMYMDVLTLCISDFFKVGLFSVFFGVPDVLAKYIEVHREWRFS